MDLANKSHGNETFLLVLASLSGTITALSGEPLPQTAAVTKIPVTNKDPATGLGWAWMVLG